MSFVLEQRQKQQLILSLGMRQSLEILQMPLVELREYLEQKLCENPMLELNECIDEGTEEFDPVPLSEKDPPCPEEQESGSVDFTYADIWRRHGGCAEGLEPLALYREEITFREMLLEQLGTMPLPEETTRLCRYLIDCLNPRGYLDIRIEEVAALLDCSAFAATQALFVIQSLQPAGVGARSLEECLVLQLVESDHFNPHTIRLVKEGLPLLASNKLAAIAHLLDTDKDTAAEACRAVRSLNPIPSRGFASEEKTIRIIPDAVIKKEGNQFTVRMNHASLPQLAISEEYTHMLQTSDDTETTKYLETNLAEAKGLVRSVQEREKTLVRILRQIIEWQPGFFADGQTLHPMTMSQLADTLELHTSTVSRAIRGKYIVCAAGTLELKTLFSTGVQNEQGEVLSASMIKQRLKKCIEAESPAQPLSDEDIRDALAALSIDISRRTVTKYRKELGILSSSKRKRI